MISEYFYEDLKFVCASAVSCKYNKEYILEPRYGKVNFNFIEKFTYINLFFKRISGNGKILINNVPYVISSKSSDVKSISANDGNIFISRPIDSIGEVAIFGIELYLQEGSDIMNWKSLVKKLSDYRGLSLINNELLAKENAYISPASRVTDIVTLPENVSVVKDDKIYFKYPCKILQLTLQDDQASNSNINIFPPRESPSPSVINFNKTDDLTLNSQQNNIQVMNFKSTNNQNNKEKDQILRIVYDSSASGVINSNTIKNNEKLLKFSHVNEKNYIFIKAGGTLTLPLSSIDHGKKYILIINAKKVSGNGKAQITTSLDQHFDFVVSNSFQDKNFNFSSFNLSKEYDIFKLSISMPNTSFGEIVISRIMILEDFNQDNLTLLNSAHSPGKQTYALQNSSYNKLNKNKKFVIVIPSYKNQEWAEKNILSALNQNYSDFRVLFTDDCSPDNTFDVVKKAAENHPNKNKSVIVKNEVRKGALENLYNMIHSCDDDEIILTLDGDDWLASPEVLNILNSHYSDDIWMTYGQYQNYPDGGRGIAQLIPDQVIKNKTYRSHTWCSSHLRTFYAWLFKEIKKEDLFYEGRFMAMTWDMAMMFPMLEMSGHRSRFISDYLYIYNLVNPINDHKVNQKLQQKLDRLVRNMPKYSLLNREPSHVLENRIKNKNKIGLLIIATGKYDQFISQLVESADKYYFNDSRFDVTYFIFTDKQVSLNTLRNYKVINIQHRGFPYASMDRFKHFTNNSEELSKMDYLYYVDVDCKFVDHVSAETLGELVGVRHCGYFNGGGTFEENKNSVFYENPQKYKYYFGGGFSGGKASSYLELSKWCYEMIERDLSNNIIPTWHDETALNRYFLDHEPEIVLTPSYHYPENYSNYIAKWRPHKFTPKIMLLEKNHKEVR
jgi:glycosyltransferase involved in cell wall biosynthesis